MGGDYKNYVWRPTVKGMLDDLLNDVLQVLHDPAVDYTEAERERDIKKIFKDYKRAV